MMTPPTDAGADVQNEPTTWVETPQGDDETIIETDITEALTDDQIQSLFDAFEDEDWAQVDQMIDGFERTGIYSDVKAGGLDRNRGSAEKLRRYWTVGEGAAKIRWGTSGDWTRCVEHLSKYLGPRAKGYCALRHKERNGFYPGSKLNKSDNEPNSIYHESKDSAPGEGEPMLEHKTVGVKGMNVVDADEGIVETIISVTGIVDNVKDRIVPGAYSKTLAKRKPKGVWSHDWDTPVSKTLGVKELMPGDPELPATMPNGDPWPANAGALKVKTQFNLETQRGREAYSDVVFFADEQEWSIGYNVPVGGAKVDQKSGVRDIGHLELYEYSPVLFGAMPLARTTSVKEAQMAFKALKRGGAAAWLTDQNDYQNTVNTMTADVEEYSADVDDVEEDLVDELDGKQFELPADQMILVKRAISTLTDLLAVVQGEVEMKAVDLDEDEALDEEEDFDEDDDYDMEDDTDEGGDPQEYDTLVDALDDIVDDSEVYDALVDSAGAIDQALEDEDTDALDQATNEFLDGVQTQMKSAGANTSLLRDLAATVADLIDQVDGDDEEEPDGGMPSEDDIERKRPEDNEEKRDFSSDERDDLADSGDAMPDGSYPIVTKTDLKNAIQASGRAKDPETVKAHIKKRAKELDAEDMIPESWTKVILDATEIKALVDKFNTK